MSAVIHRPARKAARTPAGCSAPKACAASGATAETSPMPSTSAANSTVCASEAAAIACSPSRPIITRSVVSMAIWPSWVSAMGQASFRVSTASRRKGADAGEAGAMGVMGLAISGLGGGSHGDPEKEPKARPIARRREPD